MNRPLVQAVLLFLGIVAAAGILGTLVAFAIVGMTCMK